MVRTEGGRDTDTERTSTPTTNTTRANGENGGREGHKKIKYLRPVLDLETAYGPFYIDDSCGCRKSELMSDWLRHCYCYSLKKNLESDQATGCDKKFVAENIPFLCHPGMRTNGVGGVGCSTRTAASTRGRGTMTNEMATAS